MTSLAGCGSAAPAAKPTTVIRGPAVYRNTAEGFSMPLESRFAMYRQGEQVGVWEAAFVDSKTVTSQGHTRWEGTVEVRVAANHGMTKRMFASTGLGAVTRAFYRNIAANYPGARLLGQARWVRVAGRPAACIVYILPRSATAADHVMDLMFMAGPRVFDLIVAAPTVVWKSESPLLSRMTAGFRLLSTAT